MKIRTTVDFQIFLDSEYGWRIKEISDLKAAIRSAKFLTRQTLIRASVALLYAHFEGFVKNSTLGYLHYINSRGCRFSDLKPCFIALGMRKAISQISGSNKAALNIAAVDFLTKGLEKTAKFNPENSINTESNVSSLVFDNILKSIDISTAEYESKFKLIDESLLKRRNHIAHGDYLDLDCDDWNNLADEIITILRMLKTDLENSCSLEKYKVTPSQY